MSNEHEPFILLSINHEKVSLDLRERYSADSSKVSKLYESLHEKGTVSEALILNTCNRFELYTRLADGKPSGDVIEILADFYGEQPENVQQHLHLETGQQAIQHMIEVSAGLRSQITGEAEIFGQVKSAYSESQEGGYAGKVINRVFQKGFQAAKLIRNSTSVGQGQINISNVAVELASKIFGSLSSASVLSLGTGEIGEKTVKALRSRGAERFGIASRSEERAGQVALEWGGIPHTVAELANYIQKYDIVIASVGSDKPVVTYELVKKTAAKRSDHPLFLIDLGLPRNIEQACENIENVFLYNLDDLAAIADENLAHRKQALEESREIAVQRSQSIWDSLKKRGLV